ncbi:hypothetical protein [Verminephrobacter eiseniae]|uniref:hypothetical protein n=1 Tax=Verminephrobacter eiseniae TaxID=364317 RepID=UPI002238DDC4|nr:hypothetical protein [Verminephrobacter eiseniae]
MTATLLPTHSISASAHQRISASAHQRISASAHQRISASAHQRISASAHQRISASAHQRISVILVTLKGKRHALHHHDRQVSRQSRRDGHRQVLFHQ